MHCNKPYYSLEDAKDCVKNNRFQLTVSAESWLGNHAYNPLIVVKEVMSQLTDSDFDKTIELDNLPGQKADVYKGGDFDGEKWYVKFFFPEGDGAPGPEMEENLRLELQIWSCRPDGMIH